MKPEADKELRNITVTLFTLAIASWVIIGGLGLLLFI